MDFRVIALIKNGFTDRIALAHLSLLWEPPSRVRLMGGAVEGSGGGDSKLLLGGRPLLGDAPPSSRLASYSKVRLGLGTGLTGVVLPPAVSGEEDSSAEPTLPLCRVLEGVPKPGEHSGSAAPEHTLLLWLRAGLSQHPERPGAEPRRSALSWGRA